jgi:excisionase family DNA binding protein
MEPQQLTFDQLPAAVSELLYKVTNIERQLSTTSTQSAQATDCWMSLDELCEYLPGKPAKATIYGKVHLREIPHKKDGKRLIFRKSEIDEWLNAKGRKTVAETQAQADQYLGKKKRSKSIA